MKSVCIFCGSSNGANPKFLEVAKELGQLLVRENLELIYGGASIGIMTMLADTVLEAGGVVRGVIPEFMVEHEVAHHGITELHIVNNMHERKQKMQELGDALIALPGGLGTLEEIFEMLTWSQLKLHAKPCGFLNVEGYYDKLLDFLEHMDASQFLPPNRRATIYHDTHPHALLQKLRR
ncbi:MAG: Rossman fold protein, TIGR00730 family [Deltaproteobacteria bacterium RIFCSPLOWO2_02_FULL_44_10]|nr:MAG: Rossman fold protein, TIGR00730 family [Deltaproteobacteria bacterium RIFCSPLOWO2_02_FULL_44_10]